MSIAKQSKFACLKIDDDTSSSEDEGKKLMGLSKGKQTAKKGKGQKAGKKSATNGSLVVHVVQQKPKNKSKKSKKAAQIVDDSGLIIQDDNVDLDEMKYREELKQALKESCESSSQAAQKNVEKENKSAKQEEPLKQDLASGKSPAECLVLELDKEANKIMAGAPRNVEPVVRLYRSKLLKMLEENSQLSKDLFKAKSNADKYRNRYTKICEILKDVEVNDKAKLVVQLEKARAVETELGDQIGILQGELMQATTKMRELDAKVKELSSKH